MARNRDLFDDTTMTFGEHLEVLRVHVWRALIGLIVGVVAALFFGDTVIKILKQPIDDALHRANIEDVKDDLGGIDFGAFLKQMFSGEDPPPEPEPVVEPTLEEDELEVEVSLQDLKKLVEQLAPGTIPPEPQADNSTPAADNSEQTEEDGATEEQASGESGDVTGTIVIRSDDIALFKKTVRRFEKPVTYKVEEAFMTYIKVSLVSGLVVTSPWVFYQIWLFVAAGLYSHMNAKYVYVYLPMSIGLFITGAVFCFYFRLPDRAGLLDRL